MFDFGTDIIAVARDCDPELFAPYGPLDTDHKGRLTWDADRYGPRPADDLTEWLCAS